MSQPSLHTDLKDIWKHRGLIRDFVRKDFLVRYAGSALGAFWNIIHPMVMIAIYTLVFSKIMRNRLPGMNLSDEAAKYSYSIYLCAGLLPWGMFAETFNRASNILIENGNLIKKVSFPSELLHMAAAATSTINFLIAFTFFVIFLWAVSFFVGYPVSIGMPHLLMLALIIAMQQIFAIGLGFGFSAINVFFRDVGQVIGIITQLWFWFTPIVYMENIIPEGFLWVLKFNPMYYFIRGCHLILFENKFPGFGIFIPMIGITIITLFLGLAIYRRLKPEITDEL